jgi:2-dehydropantoate 2-reductase
VVRIAIVGAGGVGGYFGGRLAAAGTDVAFLARGAHLAALQGDGLYIDSPNGNLHLSSATATHDPERIGRVDLVFFAVKLYDTDDALRLLPPLIGPRTLVIPFQNGVESVEALTSALGADHVAGGTAYVAAVVSEPGRIRHTAMGRLVFGSLNGATPDVLVELRDTCLRAGLEAVLSESVQVDIWSKFVRLTAFSGMTALARCPIGPIRDDPALRAMLDTAVTESIAVARAGGISLPATLYDEIQAATDALPPIARSTMLEDLERGRRLELPWLSGAVVRIGNELGVNVPTHQMILALLRPHIHGKR